MAVETLGVGDSALKGHDFVELRVDMSSSPLWNRDLAPTTIKERTWTTWNIAALWIGMSVVITTYTLAGGFIEAGMNWWQAMLTILLGNTIVLIPMILNAHAGTKYGVSFPVLCRAAFGTRGANVPAILRAIVACGWFGIQTWIGGTAIDALFGVMSSGWANMLGGATLMGVALHTWVAFFSVLGHSGIHYLKGCRGHQTPGNVVGTVAPGRRTNSVGLGVVARGRAGASINGVRRTAKRAQ
jgi:NCS1 family nucleobase:cation symporter-1